MNITFLKSLIISFGFHAFAISLFLIDGKEFKKSETSSPKLLFYHRPKIIILKRKKQINMKL